MNIYVGNLPFEATEDELREAFGRYGEVTSVSIITDRYTGKSRGFGFVEMSDDAAGASAVAELEGYELHGRNLKVSEARPRQERPRGGRGGGRDRY